MTNLVTLSLFNLIGVVSPGIIGLLLGAASARASGRNTSIQVLFAGVGGYSGYIVFALFMRWRDARGSYVFPPELTASLVLCLCFAVFFYGAIHILSRSVALDRNFNVSTATQRVSRNRRGCLLLSMLVLNAFLAASLNPLSSWDGLDNWARSAAGLLNYELAPGGFMGTTRTSDGPFPWFHERHPPTVYYILALSGYSAEAAKTLQGWIFPSTFIWFCGALVMWGFVHYFSERYILSTIAAYLYCSLPLLENHALLVGYADPWVVVCVLAAAAILSLAICEKRRGLFLTGLFFSLVPMTLKNTGVIYSVALLLPLILMLMARCSPSRFLILVLGAASILFYIVERGFDIHVAGFRLALVSSEAYEDGYSRIFFGSAGQLIDTVPILTVVINYIWALLVNQSFSTIITLGAVICCAITCQANLIKTEPRMTVLYLLLVSVFVLALFAVPQLVSANYANAYASPDSDMGSSRFIMIVGPILILSLAFLPKIFQLSR